MMNGNWDGGWWWAMAALMVVFWAVVIWAIVMLVQRVGGPGRSSARDLLDDRYARGEVDEDEYQRRRETLAR